MTVPVFVHATTASGAASTLAPAKPTGLAAGHLMIATVAVAAGAGTGITPPSGFNELGTFSISTTQTNRVYWKIATSTDAAATSFSFSFAATTVGKVAVLAAISGVDQTEPIHVSVLRHAAAASTANSWPPITTTRGDSLLVLMSNWVADTTITSGGVANLTKIGRTDATVAFGLRAAKTPGLQDPGGYTLGASRQPLDWTVAVSQPVTRFAVAADSSVERSKNASRSTTLGQTSTVALLKNARKAFTLGAVSAAASRRTASRTSFLTQGHALGLLLRQAFFKGFSLPVDSSVVRSQNASRGAAVHAVSTTTLSKIGTRSVALGAGSTLSRYSAASRRAALTTGHSIATRLDPLRAATVSVASEVSRRTTGVRRASVAVGTSVLRPALQLAYWLIGKRGT